MWGREEEGGAADEVELERAAGQGRGGGEGGGRHRHDRARTTARPSSSFPFFLLREFQRANGAGEAPLEEEGTDLDSMGLPFFARPDRTGLHWAGPRLLWCFVSPDWAVHRISL